MYHSLPVAEPISLDDRRQKVNISNYTVFVILKTPLLNLLNAQFIEDIIEYFIDPLRMPVW